MEQQLLNSVPVMLADMIRDWCKKTNTQLDAQSLAEHIQKDFWKLYRQQELDYIMEDVEYVANDLMNKTLTQEQKERVADRIINSEWYCSLDNESVQYYIEEVTGDK